MCSVLLTIFSEYGIYNMAAILGVVFLDKLEKVVDYRSICRILDLIWIAVGSAIHIYIKKKNLNFNNIMDMENNLLKTWFCFYKWTSYWKGHRTGIRTGNNKLQIQCLSAFSPLFPIAGQWHTSKDMCSVLLTIFSEYGIYNMAAILGVVFLDKLEKVVDYRSICRILDLIWIAVGSAIHIYIKKKNLNFNNIMDMENNLLKTWFCFYKWTSYWKGHRTGIRTGNNKLQIQCLSAFSPLFLIAGKINYTRSTIHFLAIITKNPKIQTLLKYASSVNLTQNGHYFAFDETLETFRVKFIKQNITDNVVDEKNLKRQIKAAQSEKKQMNFLLDEFLDDIVLSTTTRAIKEPFEMENGTHHPLFQNCNQLTTEGFEKLYRCYQDGIVRLDKIFQQEILCLQAIDTKGRSAKGIVVTKVADLKEKSKKNIKKHTNPFNNPSNESLIQERNELSTFESTRHSLSKEEKDILETLFAYDIRSSDTVIDSALSNLLTYWDAFRDFTVHRSKVAFALQWLKANNRYYAKIIIDNETLQSLPENCSIVDQLPQIGGDQINVDENENDMITCTFIPYLPPSYSEDFSIKMTLNHIQSNNPPMTILIYLYKPNKGRDSGTWDIGTVKKPRDIQNPEINNRPINEFQTPGYIAMAFLTLYPTGNVDLPFRDFTVHRSKVAFALQWLKANNRYYAKIIIDNETLQSLPENCSIVDQLPQIGGDQINVDENENDMITCTFIPYLPPSYSEDFSIKMTLNHIQSNNPPMTILIYLYKPNKGRDSGTWDIGTVKKPRDIQNPEINNRPINEFQTPGYIAMAFLTLYPTGNVDLQEKIYVKQNLDNSEITINDIQERIATGNEYMANRIIRYNLHWPELHKLMPGGNLAESTDRQKNLIDNSHIAAWFFIKQWWYRFEWQHRGSVHVHGIGMIQDGPAIEWEKIKNNENAMDNIVKYINTLVTTINPGINASVPGRHSCQKEHSELHDDLLDYTDLANKLQRYTRCSPSYCICVNKKEIIMARNDPLINPYNRLQLSSQEDEPSIILIQKLLLHSVSECDISAQETTHLFLGIPLYHSSQSFVSLNLNKEAPRLLMAIGKNAKKKISNLEQLTEDGNIIWSILYDNFIEEINKDLNDLLGLAIDEEEEIEEEDQEEKIEDDQDEYSQSGRNDEGNDNHVDIVNYESLNKKQELIFKRVESHYYNTLINLQIEPLKIIIMETAGTEKSYLIKAI
ncbi:hypothetical protein Glove_395g64 [Diversispora epigaea]|uniref:DUF6570 domain-containing protein n=1 Tax=Diversispora epigaea TaxID=1348612 RepID=A0A397H2S8_9GLOM|nr:hypothetical protein Glove_395g64 [Diversispora epigaea]